MTIPSLYLREFEAVCIRESYGLISFGELKEAIKALNGRYNL